MKPTETAALTGKALLQKVKELSHLSRSETAKQCGYTNGEGNSETVNLSGFYSAVLRAKGIEVDPEEPKNGRGRTKTHRVKVHANGQIIVGSGYTSEMGLNPGDEFEIKLGYKHIQLKQVEEASAAE
jgi:hypothetical protein